MTITLFLLLALFALLYQPTKATPQTACPSLIRSEAIFLIIIVITIILVRSPTWMMAKSNIDEAQWIAGALTLKENYSLWGSVDGTTSGPIVIHALYLWNTLFGAAGFQSAKVFTTLIWTMVVITTYFSLRQLVDARTARIFICPLAGLVALMYWPDFVGYNGEQVSILLISISALMLCRINTGHTTGHWNAFILGVVLGILPYTKLQAVPIGILFGLYGLILLARKASFFTLLCTVILLNILVLGYLAASGQIEDFWTSYILENIEYSRSFSGLPFIKRPYGFIRVWMSIEEGRLFVALCLMTIAGAGLLWFMRAPGPTRKSERVLWAALGYLATAAYCVWQPGTFFGHYYLFMFHPLLLTTAIVVSNCKLVMSSKAAIKIDVSIIALLFLGAAIPAFAGYSSFMSQVSSASTNPIGSVSMRLRGLANENTKLTVWGWAPRYHVESLLAQATSEAHTYRQISSGKYQEYFLRRYLSQLKASEDLLFVDATNTTESKYFRNSEFNHENYPDISKFISDNLEYVEAINGVRIYRSKPKFNDGNGRSGDTK